MKTLYININGEDVQSTDSMIVIGDERDAIIDSFYIALGEEITAGSRVRGINHKAIVIDFAKDKPEEFEAILNQWEEVKEILLSDDPTGEYTISLPPEYLHWLRYNSNPAYAEVYEKRFVGQNEAKVVLDIDSLYKDSLATIRRKVFRFWESDNDSKDIEDFVINDECANGKSKLVRELREKLDIAYIRFDSFKTEKKDIKVETSSAQHTTLNSSETEKIINIDTSYRFEMIFDYSCGYAIAKKANVKEGEYPYTCLDVWGNEVFAEYLFIRPFVNGFAIVEKEGERGRAYINTMGHPITPFKYFWPILGFNEDVECHDFKDKYAIVSVLENGNCKDGVINADGKEIVPCVYDDITIDDSYIVATRYCDNFEEAEIEYIFYDKCGNKINSFYFNENEDCRFLSLKPDGSFLEVYNEGRFEGIRNSKGRIILPAEYHFSSYEDGINMVQSSITKHGKRKKGYINDNGDIISSFVYDSDSSLDIIGDVIVVKANNLYGLISKTGHTLADCEYKSIGHDSKYDAIANLIPVRCKNGSYGYINRNGEIVIQPVFNIAHSFSEGFAYTERDGKYGFIDETGTFVLSFNFDNDDDIINFSTSVFHSGRCVIAHYDHDDRAVIDTKGNIIIANGWELDWDKFITKHSKGNK